MCCANHFQCTSYLVRSGPAGPVLGSFLWTCQSCREDGGGVSCGWLLLSFLPINTLSHLSGDRIGRGLNNISLNVSWYNLSLFPCNDRIAFLCWIFGFFLQDLVTVKVSYSTCLSYISMFWIWKKTYFCLFWLFSYKEKIDESAKKNSISCQSTSSLYKLYIFVMYCCEISSLISFWLTIYWYIIFHL